MTNAATEAQPTTIRFTANGKAYAIDVADFTGRELREFRTKTGVPLARAEEGLDPLETFVALKWLIDRRDNPALDYEELLDGATYGDFTPSEETDDDPPE